MTYLFFAKISFPKSNPSKLAEKQARKEEIK